MISPSEMKIIQIEITNSCIHHCSNCTRFCGLHEKNFMMTWDKFKHAVDSLKDFQGIAGVMGGKPLLNPQFPEMMPNWKTVVETSFYKHLIKLRRRITDSWNYRTSLILHRKRGEKKAAAVTDSQKKLSNIVLIPIYKQELSELEKQSLLQCATVFAKREICFFAPENIHFEYYQAMVPKARCEYFHSSFFQGISGYNRLMLSVDFYKRFNKYDHILIYQLDAWVFRDELDHWCSMGFDYIGAPLKASIFAARGKYVVGNGGFSLRKPAAFIRVLSSDGKMYNFNRLIEFCMIHLCFCSVFRLPFAARFGRKRLLSVQPLQRHHSR